MPEISDLWGGASVRPRTAYPTYVSTSVASPARWPRTYAGSFRDRHSRYDLRCLRRYGGYFYDAPLVVLWADYDDDYYYGGASDVWEL